MPKLALLFPGSGAQYVGMCRSLYKKYPIIQETFKEADDILGYNISKIILQGNVIKLNKVDNILLSVYVASVSYFRLYMDIVGFAPSYLAGHSLGEYSALTCSGVLSYENGLKLVQLRSQLAKQVLEEVGGTMTILKNISPGFVESVCADLSSKGSMVAVACYNSPKQVLISGTDAAIKAVEDMVMDYTEDAEIINLFASPPYHSKLLLSKEEELKNALQNCIWGQMNTPVISNVTARPYKTVEMIKNGLLKQLHTTVQWEKSMAYLQGKGVDYYVEMGPQNLMKNIHLDINKSTPVYAFDEKLDRSKIIKELSIDQKIDMNTKTQKIFRLKAISMCLTHAVSSRNYNQDPNGSASKISESYNAIKNLKDRLLETDAVIEDQDIMNALKMLETIFEAKKIPEQERINRKRDIISKTNTLQVFENYELI